MSISVFHVDRSHANSTGAAECASLEAERSASRVDLDFDFGRVFSGVLVTGFKSQEKRRL